MPGIDGLETARRLRALPGPAASLPLVALTANVSGMDRADYTAAGLVDLVPKPVERATLLAAIGRHVWAGRPCRFRALPQAARPRRPQAGPPQAGPPQAGAVDLARVASWRSGLPAPVCDALFADCIRQLRAMLPDLRQACVRQDRPALKRVTHAITGVAGNYGLAGLEAAARALAMRDPGDVDAEIALVTSEIDRAEDAVRRLPEAQAA